MKISARTPRTSLALSVLLTCALSVWSQADDREPQVESQGAEKSPTTKMLEMGAKVLQTEAPLNDMDIYLVGFHPMKEDPAHQMEAHHFATRSTRTLRSASSLMAIRERPTLTASSTSFRKSSLLPSLRRRNHTGTPITTRSFRGSWSLLGFRKSQRRPS